MKKALSFIFLVLIAVTAFAEPQIVSLSNKGKKTTIVFTPSSEDKDSHNGIGINILLECINQAYKAKHVDAKFSDTTTVTVKFKKISQLENARLKFDINGEEKHIDINKHMID